jgi:hypothetical protein
MKSDRMAPVQNFLILPVARPAAQSSKPIEQQVEHRDAEKDYVEVSTIPVVRKTTEDRDGNTPDSPRTSKKAKRYTKANSGPFVHSDDEDEANEASGQQVTSKQDASVDSGTQDGSYVYIGSPLRELSTNSPGKNHPADDFKRASIHSLDGNLSLQEPNQDSDQSKKAQSQRDEKTAPIKEPESSNVIAINGAIKDLLDQQNKRKQSGSGKVSGESVKKGRLVGRALSNLSNASAASNARHSRASSIDSMNTDGFGSEITKTQSGNQNGAALSGADRGSFNFMGRAKTALASHKPSDLEVDDPGLNGGNYQHEDQTPQMTQLGYEDPEDAVALRQKLAESRRKRSKLGQEDDDPKPLVRPKSDRRIRDDDIIAASEGWGAGRRTRQRRSPTGQEISKF